MDIITYNIQAEPDGGFGFNKFIRFYKNGEYVMRITSTIYNDIRFCHSLTHDEIINEISHAVTYEMGDPSLESQVRAIIEEYWKNPLDNPKEPV